MSKSSGNGGSSGGGCCLLPIALLALLLGVWAWSQGMNPQQAAAWGIEWGVKDYLGFIVVIVLIIGGIAGLAAVLSWRDNRRHRGW